MRIGLHLGTTGDLDQLRQEATAARGFDSAWTNQAPGGWDPLTVLTAVGDAPAELGTAVVPTYPRHPTVLAAEALTVQALTGGRFTLGIGPSHKLAITDWLGIPYTSPARHTREYLEVLRPLLRGEHVTYKGEFFTVDTELAVTAPEPPVLIAALGPRMLEVVRDLADGTIALWVRPKTVADYFVPRLGDGARVAAVVSVAVTTDQDGVREAYARDFAMAGELPAYRAMLDRGGFSGPADTLVAGDETTVLRELDRFRDAGVTDLIVVPVGERDRVVEVVRPHLVDPVAVSP
jgi:5,10-methylenetetrahydromethanopterin reductase